MKRIHCDFCDKPNAISLELITDRVSDGIGGREDYVEHLDTCGQCLLETVRLFLKDDYAASLNFYNTFPSRMTDNRHRKTRDAS